MRCATANAQGLLDLDVQPAQWLSVATRNRLSAEFATPKVNACFWTCYVAKSASIVSASAPAEE